MLSEQNCHFFEHAKNSKIFENGPLCENFFSLNFIPKSSDKFLQNLKLWAHKFSDLVWNGRYINGCTVQSSVYNCIVSLVGIHKIAIECIWNGWACVRMQCLPMDCQYQFRTISLHTASMRFSFIFPTKVVYLTIDSFILFRWEFSRFKTLGYFPMMRYVKVYHVLRSWLIVFRSI